MSGCREYLEKEVSMSRVLIINPYYVPGFKSGGPQRTVENIVDVFGSKNEIYILTQDHDFGSEEHYRGIINNKWTQVGNAKVMYVTEKQFKWNAIKQAYFRFDIIYSCGLFEQNSIALLFIHRISYKKYGKDKKIYVAPMGVFSSGAYNNASHKKKSLFIKTYKALGAFKNIIWSFTTESEVKEAEKILGYKLKNTDYIIAEDLPRKVDFDFYRKRAEKYRKDSGKLNLVFISRISPIKNLTYALKILNSKYDGEISYDIYGIREDKNYWEECIALIKALPKNVHAKYCGELKPNQVLDIFSKYDAFLFPTRGENFGHVIYESMATGCFPIISDQTPWRGEGIFVNSLDDIEGFRIDIEKFIKMDDEEYKSYRLRSIERAESSYKSTIRNSGYKVVFE
jgi:glycosyltransferase involved in cell wall biosynthesis